ncbi:transient receptor potential cation channel subfamily A member 1-like [Dysidea avara]|uniref:transient receptor potential cation channel subfamily A member 1-like n=1 Tax=Dysidea avara TaxID=196820 RepID=UPI00331CFA0C
MFVNILRTFLKVILLSILFVISFGITFYMIFYRPGMRSPFSSPFRSLIKTMVMTTGELDFDDIFFNSQEDADEGNNLFYPQIAYLVWIVFIILMPIILTNLLVGLAVDDIKGIQDKADLKHLNLMVSLIQRAVIHSDSIEVVECQNEDRKQSLINQILYQRDSYLQKAKRYFFELRKDDGRLKDDAYPLSSTEEIKKEIAELKMLIKDMKLKDNSDQSSREIEQNKKLDEHLKQMSFKSADEVKTKFIAVDEPAKTEEYTLDGISGSSNSSEVDK